MPAPCDYQSVERDFGVDGFSQKISNIPRLLPGHNYKNIYSTPDGAAVLLPLILLCVCIGLATVCKLWLDGRSAKKRNAKLGAKLGDIEMDATILPADHPRSGVPVTVVGDGQPSRESRAAQNL